MEVTKVEKINQDIGNGNWDTSIVSNQDISSWDVSNVETMDGMFLWNSIFNNGDSSGMANWNVSTETQPRHFILERIGGLRILQILTPTQLAGTRIISQYLQKIK